MTRTLNTPAAKPIYAVFLMFFCGFVYLALATFNIGDPSPLGFTLPISDRIYNKAGSIGAYLSGSLYYLFGYAGWLIPAPLCLSAYRKLRDKGALHWPFTLSFFSLFVFILLLIPAFFSTKMLQVGFLNTPNGAIGYAIEKWSEKFLGEFGSKIFLLFFLTISVVLILNQNADFSSFFSKLKMLIFNFFPSKNTLESKPHFQRTNPAQYEIPQLEDPVFVNEFNPKHLVKNDVSSANSSSSVAKFNYHFPSVELLNQSQNFGSQPNKAHAAEIKNLSDSLSQTLSDFGVLGQILGYQCGPVVSTIEFQPDPGIKQSRILALADDIALALKVDSIMVQPLKNKSALGIQVPNSTREKVFLGDILKHQVFSDSKYPLTFGLGKTVYGEPVLADLSSMPHLLIAGSTGSGKSVGVNGILCSIIMKSSPELVKMILVDPKMLELSVYEGIPHLLMPVITDPQKASLALKWAIAEMERRYKIMQITSVRNIDSFNEYWEKMSLQEKRNILEKAHVLDQEVYSEIPERLPYIMVVIDELADLMITAPKEVEINIQRLAQKARASGIHMVLATQRPSVDIITGVIKANLPCRIAYQVVSKHDSRTILDTVGAEKLLGKGDLLFQKPGSSRLERLQGALITDDEVMKLVAAVKKASPEPFYNKEAINWIEMQLQMKNGHGAPEAQDRDDPKYNEALEIAQSQGYISASFIQRQLKIGYNRAARIVEQMERQGLVEKADGSKPRRWLHKLATL